MLTAAFPAGRALIAAGLGLVAGSALQLQQPALDAAQRYALVAGAGSIVVAFAAFALVRARRRWPCLAALALGVAALAFAATGLRALDRLGEALPAELEGVDLAVVGTVASLPQRSADAVRFRFEVESARVDAAPVTIPSLLALGWYAERERNGPSGLPDLRAGQRWQLVLRLKRPHGSQNPHGYDFELQLFEQGVRATGYVRTTRGSDNRLLAEHAGHTLARARQAVREAIAARVGPGDAAGVLAALVVGDQAAIDRGGAQSTAALRKGVSR